MTYSANISIVFKYLKIVGVGNLMDVDIGRGGFGLSECIGNFVSIQTNIRGDQVDFE